MIMATISENLQIIKNSTDAIKQAIYETLRKIINVKQHCKPANKFTTIEGMAFQANEL